MPRALGLEKCDREIPHSRSGSKDKRQRGNPSLALGLRRSNSRPDNGRRLSLSPGSACSDRRQNQHPGRGRPAGQAHGPGDRPGRTRPERGHGPSGRDALRRVLENDFAVISARRQHAGHGRFRNGHLIRSDKQLCPHAIIFITAFADEVHTAQGIRRARSITSLARGAGNPSRQGQRVRRSCSARPNRSAGRPRSASPWPRSRRPA